MCLNKRREFFLYIDEFHNFTTQSFTTALSEIRKYGVGLTLAHQYLGQLDESIRQAVLANVGTLVVFRVGSEDAQVLAKEFGYDWDGHALANLDPYEIYYKLLSNGKVGQPGQAVTIPPLQPSVGDVEGYKKKLIGLSRRRYARPREEVEVKINKFFGISE